MKTRRASHFVFSMATAMLACACYEDASSPEPREIGSWVTQCETRCHQQESCDNDQFVFDHGNITQCTDDCAYYLETETNEQFVAMTDEACLEALWAEVTCVFNLDCDALEEWENQADDTFCSEEAAARASACGEVDTAEFLEDCDWPEPMDYAI